MTTTTIRRRLIASTPKTVQKAEHRPQWVCEQGFFTAKDWPGDGASPSNRSRIQCKKATDPSIASTLPKRKWPPATSRTKLAIAIPDQQIRPANMTLINPPCPRLRSPSRTSRSLPRTASPPTPRNSERRSRPPPVQKKGTSHRPARPPPITTCARPPITAPPVVSASVDPLRELQSPIGPRPANFDAFLRRQTLARDLRLEPQLYNWLAMGKSPGSLPRTFPITGGESGTSADRQSAQG